MNAIDLLVTQHREMEASLEALKNGELDGFESTADQLMSHVLVEERQFYPAVHAKRTEDILLESLEEHLSLKRVLADLLALDRGDARFVPKAHVLEEQARHHHKEEEENLFPKVRKLLSISELEVLGQQMAEAQAELLKGRPGLQARRQTAEAAPLE